MGHLKPPSLTSMRDAQPFPKLDAWQLSRLSLLGYCGLHLRCSLGSGLLRALVPILGHSCLAGSLAFLRLTSQSLLRPGSVLSTDCSTRQTDVGTLGLRAPGDSFVSKPCPVLGLFLASLWARLWSSVSRFS
ncbi:hypothetical protein PYCCODRAFT_619257 [Trametes coccinea BRFM310]|uniref:Uncharacterized protein n=1 Tax=Trametes coccinea (strain BRFM310) TaxID=1353009 RepID=A0A1Y2J3X1_TRAC3|nr:hypothetical protein PYCCODRAFT_619257 [Trametes coccinea BRFM310]